MWAWKWSLHGRILPGKRIGKQGREAHKSCGWCSWLFRGFTVWSWASHVTSLACSIPLVWVGKAQLRARKLRGKLLEFSLDVVCTLSRKCKKGFWFLNLYGLWGITEHLLGGSLAAILDSPFLRCHVTKVSTLGTAPPLGSDQWLEV